MTMNGLQTHDPLGSVLAEQPFEPITEKDLDPSCNAVMHCVFLKLKQEPDDRQLSCLLTYARRCIPGLIELQFGKNNTKVYTKNVNAAGDNTHALISRHENGRLLSACQSHPAYMALMKYLLTLIDREPNIIDFVNFPSRL